MTALSEIQIVDYAGRQGHISEFGDTITAGRHPDIMAKFANGIAAAEAISTVTGSGVATTTDGYLQLSTGAAINSSNTVTSREVVRYVPGFEMYAYFTAAFVSSGVAGSTRSIAFTNGNDGFKLIDDSGTFKLQHVRTNGAVFSTYDKSRANWEDPLDGTGASGLNIDFSKLNIFKITLGHLGVAPVRFWIHDGSRFVQFHKFVYANIVAVPHLVNPYLKIVAKVTNTTNNLAATLRTASWQAGSVHPTPGLDSYSLDRQGFKELTLAYTAGGGAGAETPFFTLANKTAYPTGGLENFATVYVIRLQGVGEGAGANNIKLRAYKGATLSAGTTTLIDYDNLNSCVQYNLLATAYTGGTQLFYDVASRGVPFEIDLSAVFITIYPGEQITFTVQSSSNMTLDCAAFWTERH